MSEVYTGNIPFNGEETKQALAKVCGEIAQKDPTFHYRIHKSYIKQFQYVLSVYDTDKNRLWQRLTWIKNRAYNQNKTPILKEKNTPMWVRARKF